MSRKKIINRRIVWLAVLTLVTVLIWVSLDSYHQLVRRDRTDDVTQLLTPLNPDLESEVLDKIKQRREYQVEDVEDFLKPEIEPTPTVVEETEEEDLLEELNPPELEEEND